MYKFHYNYIQKRYPEGKSKILFTATDSLTYEIEAEDVYKGLPQRQTDVWQQQLSGALTVLL